MSIVSFLQKIFCTVPPHPTLQVITCLYRVTDPADTLHWHIYKGIQMTFERLDRCSRIMGKKGFKYERGKSCILSMKVTHFYVNLGEWDCISWWGGGEEGGGIEGGLLRSTRAPITLAFPAIEMKYHKHLSPKHRSRDIALLWWLILSANGTVPVFYVTVL